MAWRGVAWRDVTCCEVLWFGVAWRGVAVTHSTPARTDVSNLSVDATPSPIAFDSRSLYRDLGWGGVGGGQWRGPRHPTALAQYEEGRTVSIMEGRGGGT